MKRKVNELLEEQVLVRRIVHIYDCEKESVCVCALETCESLYIECLVAVYVHGWKMQTLSHHNVARLPFCGERK